MYKIVLRKIIKGMLYGCAMFVAALIFIVAAALTLPRMIDKAVELQEALRERERAVENREQAQQELILLGRRSKSLIEDSEEDDVLPRKGRRLPNIDF